MGGVASNIVTEADLLTPMLMTVVTWQVFVLSNKYGCTFFHNTKFWLSAIFLGKS